MSNRAEAGVAWGRGRVVTLPLGGTLEGQGGSRGVEVDMLNKENQNATL